MLHYSIFTPLFNIYCYITVYLHHVLMFIITVYLLRVLMFVVTVYLLRVLMFVVTEYLLRVLMFIVTVYLQSKFDSPINHPVINVAFHL